jgi:hypothetical protein
VAAQQHQGVWLDSVAAKARDVHVQLGDVPAQVIDMLIQFLLLSLHLLLVLVAHVLNIAAELAILLHQLGVARFDFLLHGSVSFDDLLDLHFLFLH